MSLELSILWDMRRIIPILFLMFTTACMNNTSSYYRYDDGNANAYIMTADSLEYVPVKPEESSTGFYSGGEAKKIAITPEESASIRALLESARLNSTIHIPARIKASGVITLFSESKKASVIITPGCLELVKIETALKKLLE